MVLLGTLPLVPPVQHANQSHETDHVHTTSIMKHEIHYES